ncbi:MAG: phosphoadenosine phosphosulfate reductase family protein [Hyphomicrobium sp.]|jgi:3'-phosphoadenosine 5'-phosphosulfate sulfotransferase (PAPS reductase)/FAD synthetase
MAHVVGLSGGKDSTALALRLVEVEPRDYTFICNETGDELPEMQEHWAHLETLLGSPIVRVRHERDLNQEIEFQNMLPSVFARWCTRILKIEPTITYMETLPTNSTLYVGLRADEELRRGLYGEDIHTRFPLREWGWGLDKVVSYLDRRNVCIPARTDCARCPYQRLGEWRDLYQKYPTIYMHAAGQEKQIGATFRSPGRDTWPADLESLAKEFDKNRPLRPYKRTSTCRVCSL